MHWRIDSIPVKTRPAFVSTMSELPDSVTPNPARAGATRLANMREADSRVRRNMAGRDCSETGLIGSDPMKGFIR